MRVSFLKDRISFYMGYAGLRPFHRITFHRIINIFNELFFVGINIM